MSSYLTEVSGQLAPQGAGTPAPDFRLPQTCATHIALHSFLGHPIVLIFYPMGWEPVSREQLTLYQTYADAFDQLGARPLAIATDHLTAIKPSRAKRRFASHCWLTFSHEGWSPASTARFWEVQGPSAHALRPRPATCRPFLQDVSRCQDVSRSTEPRRRQDPYDCGGPCRWA